MQSLAIARDGSQLLMNKRKAMKYDTADLLEVFAEMLPYSEPGVGLLHLRHPRPDGLTVYLTCFALEGIAQISIVVNDNVSVCSIELKEGASIAVLDKCRGTIEVHSGSLQQPHLRILLALNADPMVLMNDAYELP
jgi:hypothetical protein